MGRAGGGASHLVTGGSDCVIRYWDVSAAQRCGVVSGLAPGQPRPAFEAVTAAPSGGGPDAQLIICRDTAMPAPETVQPSKLPHQQQKGPVQGDHSHRDAILDVKAIHLPVRGILSASRDGVVKVWK